LTEEFKYWLFHETVGKLVFALICLIVLWILLRFIKAFVSHHVKDSDSRYRSRKLLDFSGYVFTLLIIAIVFSTKLNNITVALGIAGAGIAFALQEVIASVAGWLAVMLGGFYKTGDRVQLGGIKGDVIDISVLRTTLMEIGQWVDGDLYNGRIVRVANSFVFKEPVVNYSADFPFLWDEIKIPIQYSSNYQKARELFLFIANEVGGNTAKEAQEIWAHALNKYVIENASTEPMVTIVANTNWVEFTIRYTVDYQKRRVTKDKLFSRILEEVDKTNGEIKFALSSTVIQSTVLPVTGENNSTEKQTILKQQ
jgi:small-conductance mechanosensitive channel